MICLDNDDAGIGAVERLCSSMHIWNLLEKKNVEITVGCLPTGCKDPGEFVELRAGNSSQSVKECFEAEVINTAMLWSDWYINRLIMNYNKDDSSSFASVCDEITTFLSKNPNPADRTKQAYEAATNLARHISRKDDKDDKEPSASLRIQLESDLLGMASRKASKRESQEIRIEAIERLAQSNAKSRRDSEIALRSGKTASPIKSKSNVSKEATAQKDFSNNPLNALNGLKPNNMVYRNQMKKRRASNQRRQMPITPHFNGFSFNRTDAAWLFGVSDKDVSELSLL